MVARKDPIPKIKLICILLFMIASCARVLVVLFVLIPEPRICFIWQVMLSIGQIL